MTLSQLDLDRAKRCVPLHGDDHRELQTMMDLLRMTHPKPITARSIISIWNTSNWRGGVTPSDFVHFIHVSRKLNGYLHSVGLRIQNDKGTPEGKYWLSRI